MGYIPRLHIIRRFKSTLLFLQNIGVGTVYINLGDEGVIHAINETKTSVVVTSQNLLPRLQKLLPRVGL